MAKLNEQQNTKHNSGGVPLEDDTSSQGTDPFAGTPPTGGSTTTSDSNDAAVMENMKRRLELATERMAQMELELTQTRARQPSEQAELTQPHYHRNTEQPANASFPGAAQGFPFISLPPPGAFTNVDSRRTSPLDLNAQQQALAMNGGFQSGTLAPPPFFATQK